MAQSETWRQIEEKREQDRQETDRLVRERDAERQRKSDGEWK